MKSRTFCRVCEPACGLVAEVEDGELIELRPDRENPITRGFACNKGIASLQIHDDPDRVNHPLRRSNGTFERVDWDTAIGEIAARLRAIVEADGPDAVSAYSGNPNAFNTLVGPAFGALLRQIGVRRSFSSGTQDCANKFAGSEAVFGTSTMHPIPDIEHTDYLLILGENPQVSHMSFLAIADPMAELKRAARRGATIKFVNPRRIESARSGLGDVVLIRPDTDLYLLAAMLCEIDRTSGFDASAVERHGKRVDELRSFVGRYPPERVADIVGLPADEIRKLAREFADAPSASIHMSTGVNMGRQGTLAYWLVHMLSFLTGNLDRKGGNVLSVGFYASAKAGRAEFEQSFVDTPWGRLRRGNLPGNLLADNILDPDRPIKAMFVLAGNPLLSVGGESRLREAFASLELLVSIDLYRNATGELADFVLPATDMFERADVNITGLGLQHRPYIQYTDAVVPPRHERREEWWILGRICQELGLKSPLDGEPETALWGRIDHMLRGRGLSLEDVKRAPHQLIDFGAHEPGDFYDRHLQTQDGRVDCCPPGFTESLDRAARIFDELSSRPTDALSLITKRDAYMHNSWYANLPAMKRGERDRNYLFMHPDDAERRGLSDAAPVRASSAHGSVETELRLDSDLMPGVVAMTHGWGNQRTPGMRFAQKTAGTNVNGLLPSGPDSFEPLSSQAHMTGIPVEVSALGADALAPDEGSPTPAPSD